MSETGKRQVPTAEEWAKIETKLSVPYGRVDLRVDEDYVVMLRVMAYEKLKYGIMVFVNGEFRGKHVLEDCEERRRFMRRSVRRYYSTKVRDERIKAFGKRKATEYFGDLDKTFETYTPLWPTFGPLKRHLLKHNTNIRLI